jgi:hypothetical protein
MGQGHSHDYLIRTNCTSRELLQKCLRDRELLVTDDRIHCMGGVWCWSGNYHPYDLEGIFELPFVSNIQRFAQNLMKPQIIRSDGNGPTRS